MSRWLVIILGLLLVLVACAPQASPDQVTLVPLPTLIPTQSPELMGDENAERVTLTFLEAWRTQDYETMYSLISFASQQAISQDSFISLYTQIADEMRLSEMNYQLNGMARDVNNARIVQIDYDMSFSTAIVGEFSDLHRIMQLVLDPNSPDWRVAWTRGDIFAEMEQGGILRLTSQVPRRANIYDRDGGELAVQTGSMVTINVVLQQVVDFSVCLSTLSQVLELPVEDIQTRFNNSQADWSTQIGTVIPSIYDQWRDTLETDCDATFDSQPVRQYPNGTLAPHIVGNVGFVDPEGVAAVEAVGFTQDAILGRTGIEASWDEALRGTPGGTLQILTPDGTVLRTIASSNAQPAQSVYLTIDLELQAFALARIQEAYNRNVAGWGSSSNGASAIVLDVNTGAILAMVSYPTFDANIFAPFPNIGQDAAFAAIQQLQADPRNLLLNRVTQSTYPSGSTFKVVTSAAVADSGIYALDQRYTCIGSWTDINGFRRRDWFTPGHGTLTLAGAITNSCNPYFYESGYQLDLVDQFLLPSYANRMGLGTFTGLTDVPEVAGFIGDPVSVLNATGYPWTFGDAVSMAIGQGFVEVTPLQMARMYAGIANGGILYRPQLVDRVGLLGDISYQMSPETNGFFEISPDVIDVLHEGLCNVTIGGGTASHIFRGSPLLNIGVCGKTGTAEDQGQDPGLTHAWFSAFAPQENPEIVVLVMVENSGEGSGVAAPIVRDIMEYYFYDDTEFNPF